MTDPKVIVALDYANTADALSLAQQLDPSLCRVKVGKELFTRSGPNVVRELVEMKFDVFLDLKYHDIPNTVAKACRAAADLGVWMLNVHSLGGQAMMEAAKKAVDETNPSAHLIAVTMLTSMDRHTFSQIGLQGEIEEQVIRLAKLTQQSGLDGIVCSAQEATSLRAELGENFQLITPGIRPVGSDKGDQHRIMTPKQALEAGSSYLVIGRPITAAPDPNQALTDILNSL